METLDWTLVQSFLAVAEAGSLSAAARVTGISQPTLGRHVQAIEASLSVQLFTRVAHGLQLTEAGQTLLPAARAMQVAAAELALTAKAQSAGIDGTVRVTASRIVAQIFLPPILARLRQEEPGIQIEIVASDTTENLLFGEADIALRMYRPTQPDLIVRHLLDLEIGLYGATDYLDRRGRPATLAELLTHDFLGQDRLTQITRAMAGLGIAVERGFFPLRCDDPLTYLQLLRAGAGLGGILCRIGDADPGLERIAVPLDLPRLPVWLVAAPRLRQSQRLRRVWDALADGFPA